MSNHTGAEWSWLEVEHQRGIIAEDGHGVSEWVFAMKTVGSFGPNAADAALLAAAPDLLKAAKFAERVLEVGDAADQLRAAIAKAESAVFEPHG